MLPINALNQCQLTEMADLAHLIRGFDVVALQPGNSFREINGRIEIFEELLPQVDAYLNVPGAII
jgi:hypothetical protein